MPGTDIKIELKGLEEVLSKLQEIADPKMTDRRLNASMKKAAQPILETAKSKVPKDEGDLERSLIINSKKLRNGNRSVRVGPNTLSVKRLKRVDTGFRAFSRGIAGSKLSIGKRTKRPANYAHLVEFGTRHTRRRPFMRPANARHGGEKYVKNVAESLWKSYRRLARQKARASNA